MNRDTLIQVFKNSYKRQVFIEHCLLPLVQNKVDDLVIYDEQTVQEIQLTATGQNYATSVIKYGEFKTRDELPRTVELYEITVNNDRQIERSRVGLGTLIKKHIIGHNAVMVNFTYENQENRSWRFSFIARDSIFQDGEMTITETNPKRYTYVFGQPEETYKTAMDRFMALANEFKITIHKIKDAFGVEKMSKQFFDDYRDVHYAGFVDYLMRSNFYKSTFNGNDKEVRDFVKKLLGRIVFLYFLQKKGWLGAKDTAYKDGDRNFMNHFFEKAGADDAFYGTWLTRLFFDTLNQKRPDDDFEMPDGEILKVPYLNGGLFEKDASKYDYLVFPADYFENLFAFFNQYNFTIYEDGPENQTVAVDPEMLGNIFENLLEDNKDKGAFYTPKEIVHYMTQESLIEYLHTHLPNAPKEEIDQFIKNKEHRLTNEDKKQIDQKLDTIKICDPAIGSGAFPMGLLQEIFSIKERIAYDLGYKVWSPATVKESIIQNSIYGVDIESGAVDIARLRFWLSLIVDEDQPKALPNLDYKIVVGNSLVSKFEDEVIEINWDLQSKSGRFQENMIQMRKDLVRIAQLQKEYFENKNRKEKEALKQNIRDTKLDILINQLIFNKVVFEQNNPKIVDMGFGLKDKDKKKNLEIDLKAAAFSQTLKKLERFKNDPALRFQHFDWKLDFPEVLNPLVNEATGFDIVIGNPPYISAVTMKRTQKMKDFFKKRYPLISGSYDLYTLFLLQGKNILNDKGVYSWIIPNKFLIADYAKKTREYLIQNGSISSLNVSSFNVFKGVGVYPIIVQGNLFGKKMGLVEYYLKEYSDLKLNNLTPVEKLPNYKTLKDFGVKINSGSTGFQAKIVKKFVIEHRSENTIPFTVSGNVDRYSYNNELVRFMKNTYSEAFIRYNNEIAKSKWDFWHSPKIVVAGMTKEIEAVFVKEPLALGVGIYGIYDFAGVEPYALTSILNSKYLTYYFKKKFKDKHLAGGYLAINKSTIEQFPLIKPKNEASFSILSQYVHNLKINEKSINDHVPNSHITESFEEVIDALVFELYFPEEFEKAGIKIAPYAEAIFKPIEQLSKEEQIAAIREAYQNLRKADNPLRNQIKLMKIELKELLLPILSL